MTIKTLLIEFCTLRWKEDRTRKDKKRREEKRRRGEEEEERKREREEEGRRPYSKSPSSGNQVDGLPLVLSNTELLLS